MNRKYELKERARRKAETRQRIEAVGIERHPADAFAFREAVVEPFAYDWHAHGGDQLLYAVRGSLHLETATARFLLPPQRAIWIPARQHPPLPRPSPHPKRPRTLPKPPPTRTCHPPAPACPTSC